MDMNREEATKRQSEEGEAEAEIRKVIYEFNRAVLDRDIDKVMSFYVNDIVAFDMTPPIQFEGKNDYRKSWENALAMMPSEATKENSGFDIYNLKIYAEEHIGFAHSLNHSYGPMSDGALMDMWSRCTQCFKKIEGKWSIVHEQYSLPVDFESGQALMNLRPDKLFN